MLGGKLTVDSTKTADINLKQYFNFTKLNLLNKTIRWAQVEKKLA